MKRYMVWLLTLLLALGSAGGALAQDTDPSTGSPLLVIFMDGNSHASGDFVSADYIGQVSGASFEALDPSRILLNGQSLDDDLRRKWSDQEEPFELSTDLIARRQVFQLYSGMQNIGFARVLGFDYSHQEASGNDYISVMLELGQELPELPGLVFALAADQPMAAAVEGAEESVTISCGTGEGSTCYELDIDGDGTPETIEWDRDADALDEEGVMHPIVVSRGGQTLQTVEFFYDNDYTTPLEPGFSDLNGDGVRELILAGTGHNTYVSVYEWKGDGFVRTDVGYYSGD